MTEKEKHGNWFVFETIPNSHFLMTIEPLMAFCQIDQIFKLKNASASRSIVKCEKGTEELILIKEDFPRASKMIFGKLMTDIDWAFWVSKYIEQCSETSFAISKQLLKVNVAKLTNEQLAEWYEKWGKARKDAHCSGMVWNMLEFEDQKLSKYLREYLENLVGDRTNAAELFSTLSTPLKKTFVKQEEQEMLSIALKAKKGEDPAKLLDLHCREFAWLPYMYEGPAWDKKYFEEVLAGLVKLDEKELRQKFEENQNYEQSLKSKQQYAAKKLKIEDRHLQLFNLAQSIIRTKALRKDAVYFGFYAAENLFKECAKRLQITVRQFRRFAPWEVKPALVDKKYDVNELNQRYNFSVFYFDPNNNATPAIYTGAEAKEFYNSLNLPNAEVKSVGELRGDCACPGKATGAVKIINSAKDMGKMNTGDVLVSMATTPDIVPAMKKASAIITDMGGMTCHAAIVSRELNIPCVIGTKIATKALKDGDRVEVDASAGYVKKA